MSTIEQFVGFIHGISLVLSGQTQDDLSLYYKTANKHLRDSYKLSNYERNNGGHLLYYVKKYSYFKYFIYKQWANFDTIPSFIIMSGLSFIDENIWRTFHFIPFPFRTVHRNMVTLKLKVELRTLNDTAQEESVTRQNHRTSTKAAPLYLHIEIIIYYQTLTNVFFSAVI